MRGRPRRQARREGSKVPGRARRVHGAEDGAKGPRGLGLREDNYVITEPGYIDTGASPNQTRPIETAAAKESDAKKLNKKRHKKLGIL